MPTFGKSPAHYVEIPDDDNPGQAKRPDAGYEVPVRDAITLTALDDWVTGDLGYPVGRLYTTAAGIHAIDLDPNLDGSWVYQLYSAERDIAVALELPDLDTFLGDAAESANSAAEAAAAAAVSQASAVSSAASSAATLDAAGRIAKGDPGAKGDTGNDGAPGISTWRMKWTGVPVPGTDTALSESYKLPYDSVLKKEIAATLAQANASATACKITLNVDGSDFLTTEAPSMATGQDHAAIVYSEGDVQLPAGTTIQGEVKTMGVDTGGATASPSARASIGQYASGVGSAGQVLNAGTAATIPLPTGWAAGDYLELKIAASSPPVAAPTGWTAIGSPVQDTTPTIYLASYWRIAQAGDSAPQVTFAANAGLVGVCMAFPNVQGTTPIDLTTSSVVNTPATAASSGGGTTDASTAHETLMITYVARFAPSAATSNITGTGIVAAGGTELLDLVTVRTTSPNICMAIYTKAISAAATTIPAYTADLTTTTSSQTARWLTTAKTLRPSAASAPGTDPCLAIRLQEYPDGFPA